MKLLLVVAAALIDADGRVLGLDDEFFHDQGAYVRTHAARVVHMTAGILPGPYRVPAYRAIGHFRLTNKTPCGTYRAPGRYESSFVRERLLDAIAAKVGVEARPCALRVLPREARRYRAHTAIEGSARLDGVEPRTRLGGLREKEEAAQRTQRDCASIFRDVGLDPVRERLREIGDEAARAARAAQ